ncbi:hypothetical protein V6N13_000644 [Hibiscus sabdariffa]
MNLPFKKLRSEQADYLVGEALDIMLSKAMATGLFSGISTGMSGNLRLHVLVVLWLTSLGASASLWEPVGLAKAC